MANQQDGQPPPSSSNTSKPQPTNLAITPDREKMSRALGAAFLQHKVQQLERNLDDLSFRRDLHPPPPIHNHQSRSTHHPSRTQPKKKSLLHRTNPTHSSSHPSTPPPIKLIDISMLIHALPILKKWVREGKFKIVIPLDVVSELDFLKTSPPPIHGLVREATCWLDKQFENSGRPSSTDSSNKACFVAQRTGNESGWAELSERFIAPPLEVASIGFIKELSEEEDEEEEEDGRARGEGEQIVDYRALMSTDLPYEYRSLLQCALYYQLDAQADQECELVIFISDKHPSCLPGSRRSTPTTRLEDDDEHWKACPQSASENTARGDQESEPVDKAVELSHWAERFGIKTQKVYPAELAEAKQWIRSYNERIKQDRQSHHSYSCPNPPTPESATAGHRRRAPRENRSSASASASSSACAAVDKQLFVW